MRYYAFGRPALAAFAGLTRSVVALRFAGKDAPLTVSKHGGGSARGRLPLIFTMRFASIVLIEDHAILREGLRTLLELEPDLKVVGEASSGADGVRVVQSTSPTLVITDLTMPGGSGLRTIDKLRAVCPNLRVLVLTASRTDEYIVAALSAGADGYVLKDASRAELLRAIRSVIAGRKYFSEPRPRQRDHLH